MILKRHRTILRRLASSCALKKVVRNRKETKGIGAVLYDMGLIEQWGSGSGKMQNLCSLADIPEPHFEEYQSGFLVEFRKDIWLNRNWCDA